MSQLAARLKEARLANGKSQKEIATLLSVSVPRVSEWENGKHTPGADRLEDLARAYGIPVVDLRSLMGIGLIAEDGESEELPGYWIGYLRGARDSARRAADHVREVAEQIDHMVRSGRRWEAASVREAAIAASRAATAAGTTPPPAVDATLAALADAQLGRMTREELLAELDRRDRQTGG